MERLQLLVFLKAALATGSHSWRMEQKADRHVVWSIKRSARAQTRRTRHTQVVTSLDSLRNPPDVQLSILFKAIRIQKRCLRLILTSRCLSLSLSRVSIVSLPLKHDKAQLQKSYLLKALEKPECPTYRTWHRLIHDPHWPRVLGRPLRSFGGTHLCARRISSGLHAPGANRHLALTWIKIKPPGDRGPQILVHVSSDQGSILGTYF